MKRFVQAILLASICLAGFPHLSHAAMPPGPSGEVSLTLSAEQLPHAP